MNLSILPSILIGNTKQNAGVSPIVALMQTPPKAKPKPLIKSPVGSVRVDYSKLPPLNNPVPVVTTTTGTQAPAPIVTTTSAPLAVPTSNQTVIDPVSTVPSGETDYNAIFEAAKGNDGTATQTPQTTTDNSSYLWLALLAVPLILGAN